MPQPILKKASSEDIPTIVSFSNRYSEGELKRLLTNPNVEIFVLQCADEILGYSVVWKLLDEAELHWFEIFEPFRGRGLSHLFMELLIKEISKSGIKKLLLEVSEKNEPAKRIYEKKGFKSIGVRKSYYPDGSNAILMELNFNSYYGTERETSKGR
jgi:ribosomal-protein-alanine N-acetyltransferase